jgi:hypothetical protein
MMCCLSTKTNLPLAFACIQHQEVIHIVSEILLSHKRDVKESFVVCEKYEASAQNCILRFR